MKEFDRIQFSPEVMGGKPTIRGMRITAGAVVGLVAAGYSTEKILEMYPYLETEDIRQALEYANNNCSGKNESTDPSIK